jgi:hypothetical protein
LSGEVKRLVTTQSLAFQLKEIEYRAEEGESLPTSLSWRQAV